MTIFYTHSGLEAVGALGGGPGGREDDGDVAEAAEAAGDVEELLRGGRYQVLQEKEGEMLRAKRKRRVVPLPNTKKRVYTFRRGGQVDRQK